MIGVRKSETTLGQRNEFARLHSGLMVSQVAAHLKGPRQKAMHLALATPAEFDRLWDGALADLVRLAELYRVDPRWLALGIVSPAGAAAIDALQRQWKRTRRMGADDHHEIIGLLTATPEPDKGAGVCRYCLCTDECGCGNCYWLDAAATICSTCLEPEEL